MPLSDGSPSIFDDPHPDGRTPRKGPLKPYEVEAHKYVDEFMAEDTSEPAPVPDPSHWDKHRKLPIFMDELKRMKRELEAENKVRRLAKERKEAAEVAAKAAARLEAEAKLRNARWEIDLSDAAAMEEFAADLADGLERDPIIARALEQGLSLRDYSVEVEKELEVLEQASVDEYAAEAPELVALYAKFKEADQGLEKLQKQFEYYRNRLDGVSGEIGKLQELCNHADLQIKNREAARSRLRAYLDAAAPLPDDAAAVFEGGAVDERFGECCARLGRRLASLARPDATLGVAAEDLAGARDERAELDRLARLVAARARAHFLGLVDDIRAVSAPQPMFASKKADPAKVRAEQDALRREGLLRGGDVMAFLWAHDRPAFLEIRAAYVDGMGRTLVGLLKAHEVLLAKHELKVADRHDLIAVDERAVRSSLTSRVSLSKRGDGFSLGDRGKVLDAWASGALAFGEGTKADPAARVPLEECVRSTLKIFVDMATCEKYVVHVFLRGGDAPDRGDAGDGACAAVLERGARATLDYFEARTASCHDAVALLLGAQLLRRARHLARARQLDVLDDFLGACDAVFWTRLARVVRANLESVQAATAETVKVGGSTAPHFATRRFAELVAAILGVFAEGAGDDAADAYDGGPDHAARTSALLADAAVLREEMTELLGRLAASLPAAVDRAVFKVNNYDMILQVLAERKLAGGEAHARFSRYLAAEREAFVDLALRGTVVGDLVDFVAATDRDAKSLDRGESLDLDEHAFERVGLKFSAGWAAVVKDVNAAVLASFSSFVNGMDILKIALTRLLASYTRYLDILRVAWRRPPAFCKELVPLTDIHVEIRDVSHSFS